MNPMCKDLRSTIEFIGDFNTLKIASMPVLTDFQGFPVFQADPQSEFKIKVTLFNSGSQAYDICTVDSPFEDTDMIDTDFFSQDDT